MTDERHAQAGKTASAPGDVLAGAADGPSGSEPAHEEVDGDAKRKRPRAKMTLRIPDDEVVRPSSPGPAPVHPAADEQFHEESASVPIQAQRIISVDSPVNVVDTSATPLAPIAITREMEDSWTPYQPMTVESDSSGIDVSIEDEITTAITKAHDVPGERAPDSDSAEAIDIDDEEQLNSPSRPSPPPLGDRASLSPSPKFIPPVLDSKIPGSEPSLPIYKSDPPPADHSSPHLIDARPSRPPAAALLDDVEAANETSEKTRPRSASEEAELAAEDVVSVEAIPEHAHSNPPPPPSAKEKPPLPSRTPLLIVPPIGQPPSLLAPPPIGETAPKRKGRLWWEELFGDDFIRTMAKITDDQIGTEVDFIDDSLGVAKGGTMLDLACGTGRHAIELARRGYQIVGFDLSLAMLARAADEAQERNQKINFVQGDMREMTFENTFDGIYCWNTSFGFFEEEKNAAVIGKVHRALRAGGQFLLDVANRDFIIQQSPSLVWFEADGCICMDEMQIDWITSRMRVKRTMMMDDGRSKEIEYSIRIYSLHELGKLLHDQGFRIAEVSGRTATPGVYFGSVSPRTLILAEKR